jgi:cysteinyl-tRNA synthetase
MSIRHLGETFDIHGGGMDLIFPHHENEIAQSCGATGKEFARYWVHNGFVQINQEKMSKSLGNFFTIREIFQKSDWTEAVTGEILRYFLLSTHYHGPLDFSDQGLKEAKQALDGFYDLFYRLGESDGRTTADASLAPMIERTASAFQQAMDNDLNTPVAVSELQKLRGDINKLVQQGLSTGARGRARQAFKSLGAVLGLLQTDQWEFGGRIATGDKQISDQEVDRKIAERAAAKKQKDFTRADAIRKELHALGITIEDKPDGTSRWKR